MNGSPFSIHVDNEIGQLQQVMIHRPGAEVVRMTQHDLDRLLFDDILSPEKTVQEHDLMTEIFRSAGCGVVELWGMLKRALERAPVAASEALVARVCSLHGAPELAPYAAALPAARLAAALIEGLRWDELESVPMSLARLRSEALGGPMMALDPLPNLMFMRDPCIAIGEHVLVGRMATAARAPEPFVVAFAIEHSGCIAGPQLRFRDQSRVRSSHEQRIEGGDILVLSPELLMIGCSQRSSAQTIERAVREGLFEHAPELQQVYVVMMPEQRSVMHLDTVLTQVDRQLFLGFAPGMAGQDGAAMPVACLDRKGMRLLKGATVLDVLREALGQQVQLVPCGGEELLHQQREQWTDGANALALSPGHILLYERNVRTIEALARQGFDEFALHSVQPKEQRQELVQAGMKAKRAVFSFPASELSRARGGGRCLTMPLRRSPAA